MIVCLSCCRQKNEARSVTTGSTKNKSSKIAVAGCSYHLMLSLLFCRYRCLYKLCVSSFLFLLLFSSILFYLSRRSSQRTQRTLHKTGLTTHCVRKANVLFFSTKKRKKQTRNKQETSQHRFLQVQTKSVLC